MKRKKTAIVIWLCAAALIAAVGFVCFRYIGLRPVVTAELGEPLPAIEQVAQAGDRYAEEYGNLPVGNHIIKVVHRGIETPVLLRVRDTAAPTAEARAQTIRYGETLTPDRLVTKIRDRSVVKMTFAAPFDFDRIGDFDVPILLEDASGNKNTVVSRLVIAAVRDSVALEAGSPVPGADAFLLEGVAAEPEALPTEAMLHHVGTYPVRFRLPNGQEATSELVVTDTVAPRGESASVWVRPGDPITPDLLVKNPQDATDLTFAFVTEPDEASMRVQTVTVRMTDEGGNTAEVGSSLIISRIEPIAVEASDEPVTAEQLSRENTVVLGEPFVPDSVGVYMVPVTIDGVEDFALITVKDTTPPAAEPRADVKLYTMHPVSPDAAFTARDFSPVTMTWIAEPDWNAAGEQTVSVRASDDAGNSADFTGTVTLYADTEPPVLYGVIDRIAYVGEPIAYFAEVYAEDAVDGRTEVAVASEVQPEKPGAYNVTFTTEDRSGNRTTAACTYRLVEATVSDEEVRALAQGVLKKIISDDMVTAEKLKAVYDYIHKNLHYVIGSDKTDWRKEAVRGFKTRHGDCFTFYSVTRALLDELGVEYMSVTRLGGTSRHYWTIVNIGTGWYHFDAINYYKWNRCFMWTDAQCAINEDFWRYDSSLYPELATERFDYETVVQAEKAGLLP